MPVIARYRGPSSLRDPTFLATFRDTKTTMAVEDSQRPSAEALSSSDHAQYTIHHREYPSQNRPHYHHHDQRTVLSEHPTTVMRIKRRTAHPYYNYRKLSSSSSNQNITRHAKTIVIGFICFVFAINLYYSHTGRSRAGVSSFLTRISNAESSSSSASNSLRGTTAAGAAAHVWIRQDALFFNQNNLASNAKHLIMVAGHSVTVTGHLEDANRDEQDWFLLDYQKHKGLPAAIVAHIQAGLQAAKEDEESLLIFSGGQTRPLIGPESEGSSYYRVVDAMDLWPKQSTVRARTTSEEFATDSFTNLLYSICRFKEITGQYPVKITVVSFTFKQTRFETLHVPALNWPVNRFQYIGVDPPVETGFNLEEATQGELKNAAKPFQSDPYGCHSPVLKQKRRERNPFSRTPPYELSCPDMAELLRYCGLERIAKDKVPWETG